MTIRKKRITEIELIVTLESEDAVSGATLDILTDLIRNKLSLGAGVTVTKVVSNAAKRTLKVSSDG